MLSRTSLLLIRHADAAHNGQSTLCGGSCDLPLTSLGRRQVELLRVRLAIESTAVACYTSPLRRARETAEAAPSCLPPEPLDSLREIHAGKLDGLPIDHVQALHPDVWQRNLDLSDDDFAWPGGETYRAFRERALSAARSLAVRHSGHRVLVFTHAGIISQIVGALTATPAARWDLYRPANASVTEIVWSGGSGELISFDDQRHLAVPAIRSLR